MFGLVWSFALSSISGERVLIHLSYVSIFYLTLKYITNQVYSLQVDQHLRPIFEVKHNHRLRGKNMYCTVRFCPKPFSSIVVAALSDDDNMDTDDEDTIRQEVSLRIPAVVTSWLRHNGEPCRQALK